MSPLREGKKLDPCPYERLCPSSSNKLNELFTRTKTGGGDNILAWRETDNAGMENTRNTLSIREEVELWHKEELRV